MKSILQSGPETSQGDFLGILRHYKLWIMEYGIVLDIMLYRPALDTGMPTWLSFDPLILLIEALHLGDHRRLIFGLAVCKNDSMTPIVVVLFY